MTPVTPTDTEMISPKAAQAYIKRVYEQQQEDLEDTERDLDYQDSKWFGLTDDEFQERLGQDDYDWDIGGLVISDKSCLPKHTPKIQKKMPQKLFDDYSKYGKKVKVQTFYSSLKKKSTQKSQSSTKVPKVQSQSKTTAKSGSTAPITQATPSRRTARPQRQAALQAMEKLSTKNEKESSVMSSTSELETARIVKTIAPEKDFRTQALIRSLLSAATIDIERFPNKPDFGFNYVKYGLDISMQRRCLIVTFAYQTKAYLSLDYVDSKLHKQDENTNRMYEGFKLLSMLYSDEILCMLKYDTEAGEIIHLLTESDFVNELLSDYNPYEYEKPSDHWLKQAVDCMSRSGTWIFQHLGPLKHAFKSKTKQKKADSFTLHLSDFVGEKDCLRAFKVLQHLARAAAAKISEEASSKDAKYTALNLVQMMKIHNIIDYWQLEQLLTPYRNSVAPILNEQIKELACDFDEAVTQISQMTRNIYGAMNCLAALGAFKWSLLAQHPKLVHVWHVYLILTLISIIASVEQIEDSIGVVYMVAQSLSATENVNNFAIGCMFFICV